MVISYSPIQPHPPVFCVKYLLLNTRCAISLTIEGLKVVVYMKPQLDNEELMTMALYPITLKPTSCRHLHVPPFKHLYPGVNYMIFQHSSLLHKKTNMDLIELTTIYFFPCNQPCGYSSLFKNILLLLIYFKTMKFLSTPVSLPSGSDMVRLYSQSASLNCARQVKSLTPAQALTQNKYRFHWVVFEPCYARSIVIYSLRDIQCNKSLLYVT